MLDFLPSERGIISLKTSLSRHKALVTGGAGFLGSHLCQRLLSNGWEVLCVDNFYTGSQKNIQPFLDNPHFELIHHDICYPLSVKVDAIYHLACPASPVHYQRDPIQTTKTSVLGALNMLSLAERLHAPILFSSTSEVYGDPHQHPQREEYWGHVNSIGPRACYDEGKRCAESLFMDYHRQHQVDIRIARIFNTYGPNMCAEDGRVISNFIVQALQNKPLTIYGDGSQSRSFCYVDDLISGLILLMEKGHHLPINIGNPVEKSMNEIASLVLELTQSKSVITYHSLPLDDPKQRCPDISKARAELGWEPMVPLLAGLKKTIAYFQELQLTELQLC